MSHDNPRQYAYNQDGEIVYRIPYHRHGDGAQDTDEAPVWLLSNEAEALADGAVLGELPDVITDVDGNGIFGRVDANGNVCVLTTDEGMPVTRIDADLYPVGSELSTRYEHAEGITLTREDAEKYGLEIEE